MKDTNESIVFEELVAIDNNARGVLISPKLTGLFPDNRFRVHMPDRDWYGQDRTARTVSIALEADGSKICVRATNSIGQAVPTPYSSNANPVFEKVIEVNLDRLSEPGIKEGLRFDIQVALAAFGGIYYAHTGTHRRLTLDL